MDIFNTISQMKQDAYSCTYTGIEPKKKVVQKIKQSVQ